ncbi:hypothetical protein ABT330_14140 [Streptomyces sp. NPDC000658]
METHPLVQSRVGQSRQPLVHALVSAENRALIALQHDPATAAPPE